MSPAVLIALGVAGAIIAVIGVAKRNRIVAWMETPPMLCRGHIVGLFALSLIGPVLAMVIGLVARERYAEQERRANITRAEVKRLAEPTVDDIIRLLRIFYRECSQQTRSGAECRRRYVQTITRVVRVEGAQIVPAGNGPSQPMPRRADRTSSVVRRGLTGPQGVSGQRGSRGQQGAQGPRGPQGEQGPAGNTGRLVDSVIVDGLENRVADLERGLAGILGRLGVLDAVCRLLPAACR